MKRSSLTGRVHALALVAVAFAIVLPVEAEKSVVGEGMAAMEVQSGTMTFRPSVGNGTTLTVTGSDYRSTERFAGGQTPGFVPVDQKGFSLPDGLYHWELVENTRLPAARAGAPARPANGRAIHRTPAQEGRRQSGSFSILNGRVVDPTLVEETADAGTGRRSPAIADAGSELPIDDSDNAAPDDK